MKTLGQTIGAAIVGLVCLALLPVLIPLIVLVTLFYIVIAVAKAIIMAIKVKPSKPS